MFDAEYFCNPNVFTFLFNKRHLYNSVSGGCFSVSLDKMRIINKENKRYSCADALDRNKPFTISGDPSKQPNDNIKTKLKNNSTTITQEACGRASITSQVLKGINQPL